MSGLPDMRTPVGSVPIIPNHSRWKAGHGGWAPEEPEYRPGPVSAPAMTPEELARQLAEDPEFREWYGEEQAARYGVLTRRAIR